MITISNEQFLEEVQRTAKDWDGGEGIQCVDAIKWHCQRVYGIKLGVFGGSARAGWFNKKKTFDPKIWQRIPNAPDNFPVRGDYIFYDEPVETGHVAIVWDANKNDVLNLEMNGASGNGLGKGYDAMNLEARRDYRRCLGWYHKI